MTPEQINYKDIIELGFEVDTTPFDKVYFNQYGYELVIITKKLTKRIYLDWSKEERICYIVRIDKNYNIIRKIPLSGLGQLKRIVDFFTGTKKGTELCEGDCDVMSFFI